MRAAQFRAARAANAEVIRLYWPVGRDILERKAELGWGAKVVDRMAIDMRREFPDQTGWVAQERPLYARAGSSLA